MFITTRRWSAADGQVEMNHIGDGTFGNGFAHVDDRDHLVQRVSVTLPDGSSLQMRDTSHLEDEDLLVVHAEMLNPDSGEWIALDASAWRRVGHSSPCGT